MDESLTQKALHWIAQDPDEQTKAQLRQWLDDENESAIARAFSGSLTFGTAGLRAEFGPGSSGMNRVNIRKTTAGLCRYVLAESQAPTLVVGFDARHKSDVFAQDVVDVARAWGVHVVAVNEPDPTPVLAYFTRELSAHAGVMITASHNPKSYNGYKVFAKNGAQIVAPADAKIVAAIEGESPLPATARGSYRCVSGTVIARFEAEIASLATPKGPLSIAYTALHGVGAKTTQRVFAKAGFALHCVDEQCAPDGEFPTVRFPNPEEDGALDLLQKKMIEVNAAIGLAQDPDADRLGVLVAHRGQCHRLTGNEIGLLLGHHLLTTRPRSRPVTVTTVVSSPLFSEMSRTLGARTERTLTGFKDIEPRAGLRVGRRRVCLWLRRSDWFFGLAPDSRQRRHRRRTRDFRARLATSERATDADRSAARDSSRIRACPRALVFSARERRANGGSSRARPHGDRRLSRAGCPRFCRRNRRESSLAF